MASFIKLEDSPMFHKQIYSLERTTEELKDRCQRLNKGCKKFMDALGGACNGDAAFADSLEAFGGGHDDPISVSIGGPVMSKFVTAFRELATYKELLRSQVEHVLIDRLTQFLSIDLQNAKDSRQRFDKAIYAYDQARERFASLKKSSRDDIVAELEEVATACQRDCALWKNPSWLRIRYCLTDLHNSKSAFERSRFNLVNALTSIEAKKKFEFLESFGAIMDGYLRYFKLGYELLSQMEPYIHQVLTYAQQAKELANVEHDKLAKRIQEFRTQTELDHLRASSNVGASTSTVGINGVGMSSNKNIEAIMQSTANGQVQTIKQGYLLKRSSSLRADWKRRFFVLDSHGTLYYHRYKGIRPSGSHFQSSSTSEHNSRVFARFRARHHQSSLLGEEKLACRTVDLCTSTIKIDADDTNLRLCFRIISPAKSYTLQAENEADRMDWMNKITGVIASLLNAHLQQLSTGRYDSENGSIYGVSCDFPLDKHESSVDDIKVNQADCVSKILREIPGNNVCAECNAPEPDWASLNLGILMCIECSGVHRNLGVHISKVRSITLDVKVWEPTILGLFGNLGNSYCNSIWEELLQLQNNGICTDAVLSVTKPSAQESIQQKEKYIQAKYVDKILVSKEPTTSGTLSHATCIWEAVKTNNLQEVYRLIVTSDMHIVNTTYDEVDDSNVHHHANEEETLIGFHAVEKKPYDPPGCLRTKDHYKPENCLHGCSLLHLACQCDNTVMLELLLQFGADINRCDFHGRTPLHHCISKGKNQLAKFLLRRGACSSIKDGGGLGALERAMEMGAITDEELFILLTEAEKN